MTTSTIARDEIEIEIVLHEEDIPVRGNAMASGDDKLDRRVENAIIRRLDNGDLWAWCTVEVRATFDGYSGSTYLGGCSYKNEKDFKKGGYYEDMVREAITELEAELERGARAADRYFGRM